MKRSSHKTTRIWCAHQFLFLVDLLCFGLMLVFMQWIHWKSPNSLHKTNGVHVFFWIYGNNTSNTTVSKCKRIKDAQKEQKFLKTKSRISPRLLSKERNGWHSIQSQQSNGNESPKMVFIGLKRRWSSGGSTHDCVPTRQNVCHEISINALRIWIMKNPKNLTRSKQERPEDRMYFACSFVFIFLSLSLGYWLLQQQWSWCWYAYLKFSAFSAFAPFAFFLSFFFLVPVN